MGVRGVTKRAADRPVRLIASQLVAIASDQEKPKTWIELSLQGEYKGHSSGEFALTDQVYDEIIANFERQQNPVPLDYEHASVYGDTAPAAGWIQSLEKRGAALWALVEFTPRGAEYVKNGEYRFCSAVIVFNAPDRKTGEPMGAYLHSAGLTNVPFIDGMQPITLRRLAVACRERVMAAAPSKEAYDRVIRESGVSGREGECAAEVAADWYERGGDLISADTLVEELRQWYDVELSPDSPVIQRVRRAVSALIRKDDRRQGYSRSAEKGVAMASKPVIDVDSLKSALDELPEGATPDQARALLEAEIAKQAAIAGPEQAAEVIAEPPAPSAAKAKPMAAGRYWDKVPPGISSSCEVCNCPKSAHEFIDPNDEDEQAACGRCDRCNGYTRSWQGPYRPNSGMANKPKSMAAAVGGEEECGYCGHWSKYHDGGGKCSDCRAPFYGDDGEEIPTCRKFVPQANKPRGARPAAIKLLNSLDPALAGEGKLDDVCACGCTRAKHTGMDGKCEACAMCVKGFDYRPQLAQQEAAPMANSPDDRCDRCSCSRIAHKDGGNCRSCKQCDHFYEKGPRDEDFAQSAPMASKPGVDYCPGCGTKEMDPEGKQCPECGFVYSDAEEFAARDVCGNCGHMEKVHESGEGECMDAGGECSCGQYEPPVEMARSLPCGTCDHAESKHDAATGQCRECANNNGVTDDDDYRELGLCEEYEPGEAMSQAAPMARPYGGDAGAECDTCGHRRDNHRDALNRDGFGSCRKRGCDCPSGGYPGEPSTYLEASMKTREFKGTEERVVAQSNKPRVVAAADPPEEKPPLPPPGDGAPKEGDAAAMGDTVVSPTDEEDPSSAIMALLKKCTRMEGAALLSFLTSNSSQLEGLAAGEQGDQPMASSQKLVKMSRHMRVMATEQAALQGTVKALSDKLAKYREQEKAAREADALAKADELVAAGRILPADRDTWRDLALQAPERFVALSKTLGQAVPTGRVAAPGKAGDVALDVNEIEIGAYERQLRSVPSLAKDPKKLRDAAVAAILKNRKAVSPA